MPNFHVGTINVSSPTSASVGVASTSVVPANNNRVGLVLTNTSSGTMYLGLGGFSATLNAGIILLPNGGSWVMDEYNFNNELISAIAHSANSNLSIQEFIR